MNRNAWGGLAATVAVGVVSMMMMWPSPSPTSRTIVTPSPPESPVSSAPSSTKTVEASPEPAAKRETAEILDQTRTRLANASDGSASRKILAELRALLDTLPRDAASREVKAFLDLKKDAATKLDATVKPGGALGDASSLRVFLLDYLGQIDRPAAALVGKEILSVADSPDEWAVSMRNVAWADDTPETLAYLRTKAGELLANSGWRQNSSAGYLEAFDVIVHTRGYELTPQLTSLLRDKNNRAVAHAAYLTLDRLTIADPAATLASLAEHPELMEGREQTRANFFARADVRDPAQRALLERYLLDPARSPEELRTFTGLFPNANHMVSSNLLTATPAPGDLAARDLAALGIVESWLTDPRFAKLKLQFTAIRERLWTFVNGGVVQQRNL